MRRLDRYIIATVVGGAATALLIILSLSLVFEFIDESGNVGQGTYSMLTAVAYVLLITPQRAYEAFPIATLIGALVGLGGLAARHELVAMRAAGVSVFAIGRAVVIAGLLLALLSLALGEWVAPASERLAQSLRAGSLAGRIGGSTSHGFWVRDGDRFLHVDRAPAADVIEGVTIYRVYGGELRTVTHARRGKYRNGAWQLHDVVRQRITTERIERRTLDHFSLQGDLSPDMLDVVVVPPETLAIADLYRYIGYLKRNNLDSARYRLAFWVKLATPLATVTMLLLTVPLVFGSLRSVGAGQQIFVGVMIGVAFFLFNRLLGNAGLVYGLPPVVSAMAPTLVFLAAGLFGLTRVR